MELVTISPGVFPPYLIDVVCCFGEVGSAWEFASTILLSPGLLLVARAGGVLAPSVSDTPVLGEGGLIWLMMA